MKMCLAVDASKVVRMVARKIIEELGFVVEEAEDFQVALDKSMVSPPDIVLLDWNMLVMGGINYLRALRVTEEGRKPIVASCTSKYLMEPFDSDIIQSKSARTGVLQIVASGFFFPGKNPAASGTAGLIVFIFVGYQAPAARMIFRISVAGIPCFSHC
jgi:two-component system chemotaxis response regulator CheY